MASPSEAVAEILALAADRPATLGAGRLICIDGRAGSGKTTLAGALRAELPDARTVHLDDLYDGWDGLTRVGAQLATLLGPLSADRPGHYRRYDWHSGCFAETVTVPPGDLLIVEGVGAGHRDHAAACTVLVWLDADATTRKARALARDGEVFAPYWDAWARREATYVDEQRPDLRSDLVVTLGEA